MAEIKTVKEHIPATPGFEVILNIVSNGVNAFTHGFHKYPAKYIPHIPRWAIHKYLTGMKEKNILDPFCGSGTTLVEGKLAGHHVYGMDIDPLSVLISKVKTTNLDKTLLKTIHYWVVETIQSRSVGSFVPDCDNIQHWFTRDAIHKLSIIRTVIDEVPAKFGYERKVTDIYNLLIICFSSIIRRVSNADNQSQKTYVSHTKPKTPEEVYALFFKRLTEFVEKAQEFSAITDPALNSKPVCGSSVDVNLTTFTGSQPIDLIVTSPPYIKAIDYIYNQMAELFWTGDLFDLETQPKQNARKKQYIGNKQIHKTDYFHCKPVTHQLGIPEIDQRLKAVYDQDKKNGHKHFYIAYHYFLNMERHFAAIATQVNTGTHYIMVVGDCEVSGIKFELADFLVKVAEKQGFKLDDKWGYQIKNRYMRFDRKGRGGIINIDWVLDFERL